MPWILLDVLIGALSLVVVGLVGWALYKQVRRLLRQVSGAAATLGQLAPPSLVQPGSHLNDTDLSHRQRR